MMHGKFAFSQVQGADAGQPGQQPLVAQGRAAVPLHRQAHAVQVHVIQHRPARRQGGRQVQGRPRGAKPGQGGALGSGDLQVGDVDHRPPAAPLRPQAT
ncbi:MAG: hypothetical protein M3Z21_04845, partial [Pseudomonadota bacterium]|nr:hypothetical protein [Pseudomonadota bacterium]